MLDHLIASEIFGLIIERPTQQEQVVIDRFGEKADVTVKVNDHRVERVGVGLFA